MFSYKNKKGSYDIYWIIDFNDGYVYFFTEGIGDNTCDKVKIASGNLNNKITATWYDNGDQWSWYLHFKYENFPETLVVNDHLGLATEFRTTDLSDALSIRGTKKIISRDKNQTQQGDQQSQGSQTKSPEELARESAYEYRDKNKDTIISVYRIYEYLSGLGYSEKVCAKVCFEEKLDGIYYDSAMYDYERIQMLHNLGYSRQAIIDYYEDFAYPAEIEYLVDECLAGRKLTYEYIGDELQLVEHN